MIRPTKAQVRRAEANLRAAGHKNIKADGRLTAQEKRTVATVQRARGIAPTGKLTERTRGSLAFIGQHARDGFDEVRGQTLGQKSGAIKSAERRLQALGFATGKVDGILDQRSAASLADFKRDQFDIGKGRRLTSDTLELLGVARGGRGKTAADASARAERLLLAGLGGRDEATGSDVTRDAADVNDGNDTSRASSRHVIAAAEVAHNAPLEKKLLAAMSPADQASYKAARAELKRGGDSVAALAMQKLLFDGKFQRGVGSQLGAVATGAAPLSPNVDRRQFLADLVQECAAPQAISQGPIGSCGPTSVAQDLAMRDPAEYARLAIGVASPAGRVAMRGGMELVRPAGTDADDGTGRSSVQRMLGSAMYEVTNGDKSYSGPGDMNGSTAEPMALLRSQLYGRPAGFAYLQSDENKAASLKAIDESIANGQRPIVAMQYGEGNHYLSVTGRGSDENGPFVSLMNPWGREERIREADFLARMFELQYDPAAVSPGTIDAMGYTKTIG